MSLEPCLDNRRAAKRFQKSRGIERFPSRGQDPRLWRFKTPKMSGRRHSEALNSAHCGRMGRFASTVAYYESARAPYGAAFFTAAAQALGLDHSQRLLDVGAGPGVLAIGFRPYCREVVGVDPEPGMVEAARAAADRAGVAIAFIEGRFEDTAASLGAFDLVTIGRAIHWLDPGLARMALDRAVAPRGRILVCHASSVGDGRNRWLGAFNAVRNRWRADRPAHDRPARDLHAFFAGGPFVPRATISVEGDLHRSPRTLCRPPAVDVDLVAGAAWRQGSGHEGRDARSARALRHQRDDRGRGRSAGRSIRARRRALELAGFRIVALCPSALLMRPPFAAGSAPKTFCGPAWPCGRPVAARASAPRERREERNPLAVPHCMRRTRDAAAPIG